MTTGEVDNRSVTVFHAIDELEFFSVTVKLFLRGFHISVDFSEVKLHWSVLVGAFEPAIKEAAMDLSQLEHYFRFYVMVDDQLGQAVPIRCMRVTQVDL